MRPVQAALLLMLSGAAAAEDGALAALRALPASASVEARLEQRSVRPGDEEAEATLLHGRLVLDPPRWYLRLTDPEKEGWRQTLRGDGRVWEDIEVLGPDQEPRVQRHAGDDAAVERTLALVRRDLDRLGRDFALSATAAADGWRLGLVPRDPAWGWTRAELDLDPAGRVRRAVIDEQAGVRKTITVQSATYGAAVDPVLFQGLAP
ncbi:MAG: Outer rane lipoprotein carrier protein LolA-like [Planctomycetota bacterium]|jgi:hypothetical protein